MTTGQPSTSTARRRYASIDWMRGIVMLLMVVDHASLAFNGNRFALDSAGSWTPGTALPPLEFSVRWLTHLCAPTFVFLAGTALAIMVERRLAKGMDPGQVDRDIVIRGVIILLVDPILISFGVRQLTFQVMYAIGAAMILMAVLRKLPSSALVALSLAWIAFGEIPTGMMWDPGQGSSSIPAAFVTAWYLTPDLKVLYPLFPWLAMMMLGWVFGRHLLDAREGKARVSPAVTMLLWGGIALTVFHVVRYANEYGNMFLYREGGSILQWLHVSKYPPSMSFMGLELGVLFVTLGVLMLIEPLVTVRHNGVLLVFGQTAFFFYVVHRFVFDVSAHWFGLQGFGDLTTTMIVSLAMLMALYPCCRWYRSYKRAHPDSVLRFF
jgi:uncharacterized membrane protein